MPKKNQLNKEPDLSGYSPPSIGNLMKQHFPSAEIVNANTEGVQRCRFDMFVRYKKTERREKHVFTYRGDHFGETDPAKMLWSLIRMFINNYPRYFLAELYDNTKPKNDPQRIIIKFNGGFIKENRLLDVAAMIEDYPVPEWLKPKE